MKRPGTLMVVPFIVLFHLAVGQVSSQPVKTIELVGPEGTAAVTLAVSDSSILVEGRDDAAVALLTPDAVVHIDHKSKTYFEYRYDEMKTLIDKKLEEFGKMPTGPDAGPQVDFKLTDAIAMIGGFKSRKLLKLDHGRTESEIWVCDDLMPANLRPVNEKMRRIFTSDYWRRSRGNPGLLEVVLLYGIPLRIGVDGKDVLQARVSESVRPVALFHVPSGYQRIEQK